MKICLTKKPMRELTWDHPMNMASRPPGRGRPETGRPHPKVASSSLIATRLIGSQCPLQQAFCQSITTSTDPPTTITTMETIPLITETTSTTVRWGEPRGISTTMDKVCSDYSDILPILLNWSVGPSQAHHSGPDESHMLNEPSTGDHTPTFRTSPLQGFSTESRRPDSYDNFISLDTSADESHPREVPQQPTRKSGSPALYKRSPSHDTH